MVATGKQSVCCLSRDQALLNCCHLLCFCFCLTSIKDIHEIMSMGIAVCGNKFCSSKSTTPIRACQADTRTPATGHLARRGLLLALPLMATAAEANDSRTLLLQKYLKKSEENKAKNDKERLDSYYKRNYKDYFDFVEGSVKGKKELTEAEKGILEWLQKNK